MTLRGACFVTLFFSIVALVSTVFAYIEVGEFVAWYVGMW